MTRPPLGPIAVVVGLGFGDEGKGTVTDHLVRSLGARTVVRFNGGPQAGHNVVAPDGRWHCFAQLGAGSFLPGVETILGPQMRVELETLAAEASVLESKGVPNPLGCVTIDPDCVLVTPMHKLLGQLAEVLRGEERLGTCGMGVGEAVRGSETGEAVRVADLLDGPQGLRELRDRAFARAQTLAGSSPTPVVQELLVYFRERCQPEVLHRSYLEVLGRVRLETAPRALRAALARGPLVFEGAQGALLDRTRGFAPYVTQSRTTADDALELSAPLVPRSDVRVWGVLRAYGHRHGPGPFPTEDPALAPLLADPYNAANRWQGPFRVGWFDALLGRYALGLAPAVDALALTGLDRLASLPSTRLCEAYSCSATDLAHDDLVARDGERITALRAPSGLEFGLRLGRVLASCRPAEWKTFAPTGAVEAIEQALRTPIALVSTGPRSTDKHWRP